MKRIEYNLRLHTSLGPENAHLREVWFFSRPRLEILSRVRCPYDYLAGEVSTDASASAVGFSSIKSLCAAASAAAVSITPTGSTPSEATKPYRGPRCSSGNILTSVILIRRTSNRRLHDFRRRPRRLSCLDYFNRSRLDDGVFCLWTLDRQEVGLLVASCAWNTRNG